MNADTCCRGLSTMRSATASERDGCNVHGWRVIWARGSTWSAASGAAVALAGWLV